jgi:hypothetical protein
MSATAQSIRLGRFDVPALLVWAAAVAIAVFLAMLFSDSAIIEGLYIPQGNDSFYHAQRILDALGERGFYQFDERLHAPDGRLVPWPWAYDWLMACVARVALWLDPVANPLAVLFYVPVVFILINAGLFLGGATALGLSIEMRAVALLCFALSPLTQLLHAYGMLDHHFIEYFFVLASLWLGLLWLKQPASTGRAAALGVVLGLAPGFHTGLFMLQVAPLATIFVLWLRQRTPPARALYALAIALPIAMQVVLWPAVTFRQGYFDFGLLSWFHLYAGLCTALSLGFMARWPCSQRSLAAFAVLVAVLLVPMLQQLTAGSAFVSGNVSILPAVAEARSVYMQWTRTLGPWVTASFYSWLLVLVPVMLVWHAYAVFKQREPLRVFYAMSSLIGLTLMLAQFRFHYFGFFALITTPLVAVDSLRERFRWHRGAVLVAALITVVLAYQPALRSRLFLIHSLGIDPDYANSVPIYLRLARECAADPGVVLGNTNDGNPILFHTDCGIITNNFILSQADDDHLRRAGELLRMPPEDIRGAAPEVKYLLVRTSDFMPIENGRPQLMMDNPIVRELLLKDEPPPGVRLLYTVNRVKEISGPEDIYARLYKLE